MFWTFVLCSLNIVWLLHTLKDYAQYELCDFVVCLRETMSFALVMSGLVKNFNIGIYSDIIIVINVKVCRMVPLIELNLFIPLSVTLAITQGQTICQDQNNVEQF